MDPMFDMRSFVVTIVYIFTFSSFVLCQGALGEADAAYEAIIDKNEALFKFPLNPREHYEWGPWGLQYSWHVDVSNNGLNEYGFGFSIYGSMSYEPFFNGDIRKLLRAGQFDLWKEKSGGDGTLIGLEGVSANGWVRSDASGAQPIVEKSIVNGYATQKKLIIRLQGESTVREIFAHQPSEVTFSKHMFAMAGGSKPVTIRVHVTYTESFLSSRKSSLLDDQISQLTARQILNNDALASSVMVNSDALFIEHCALCHGKDGVGGFPPQMAPSLVDNDWLYGGGIERIERTITMGREGVMVAHANILKPEETDALVKAVMAGKPTEEPLYSTKGCIACHGPDGEGLQVLGAANLTDNTWRFPAEDQERSVRDIIMHGVNFPGDPKSREAIMPKFGDRLSKVEIRKLAVYVYKLGGGQESRW